MVKGKMTMKALTALTTSVNIVSNECILFADVNVATEI